MLFAISTMLMSSNKTSCAQAATEFAICFPILLFAGLGSLQLALLAEAKLVSGYAVHNAARCLSVQTDFRSAHSMLGQAKLAAAFSLAGITPVNKRATVKRILPSLTSRFTLTRLIVNQQRLENANRQIDLTIIGQAESPAGKELLLELNYDYPLVVPLSNWLLLPFGGRKSTSVRAPARYYYPLKSRSLTRFRVTE